MVLITLVYMRNDVNFEKRSWHRRKDRCLTSRKLQLSVHVVELGKWDKCPEPGAFKGLAITS